MPDTRSCSYDHKFCSNLEEVEDFLVQEFNSILSLFDSNYPETFKEFEESYFEYYDTKESLIIQLYDLQEQKVIENKFTDLEYLFDKCKNENEISE